MSAISECALCDPGRVPESLYRVLFETYGWGVSRDMQMRSAPRVARLVSRRCAVVMEPEDVRKHFQNHGHSRPQPRPSRRIGPGNLDVLTERLSARQLRVADLVCRVGVLSIDTIRRLVYEPHLAGPAVAQAASSREFRPLVFRHILYRAFPPPDVLPSDWPSFRAQALLMPGRNSVPLMEHLHRFRPRPVTSARALSHHRLRVAVDITRDIASLCGEPEGDRCDIAGNDATVRFCTESWHGPASVRLWFDHPLRRRPVMVRHDGMTAVGLRVPVRGIDTLLPFFYLADQGWSEPEETVERIMSHALLTMSRVAEARLRTCEGETPPLVCIHRDARRMAIVAAALRRRCTGRGRAEIPRVVMIERSALGPGAWVKEVALDPLSERREGMLAALVRLSPVMRARADVTSTTRMLVDMGSEDARPRGPHGPRRPRPAVGALA